MIDFDPTSFWDDAVYAHDSRVDVPLTDELLSSIEEELGYTLPDSYVDICRVQNGGIPHNTNHRTSERTSWAEDHVAITGVFAIGRSRTYGLCGRLGSQFMMDEWGYPPIGIYFADCQSAGHHMLCLDYRETSNGSEPRVVHVDQEFNFKITFVANDFASFIRGLEPDEAFDEE